MTALLLTIAVPAVAFAAIVYVTGKLQRPERANIRPAQRVADVLSGDRRVDVRRRQRIEVIR